MQFMFCAKIIFIFKIFQYDHPKWFLNKELKDCKDILKQNAKVMLPGRDIKGRKIYLSRMCEFLQVSLSKKIQIQCYLLLAAVGNLNLFDLATLDELWFESMLNDVETIEKGIVMLLDMNG
jgi:hypothetical protein